MDDLAVKFTKQNRGKGNTKTTVYMKSYFMEGVH